jgi:hypothetical protein
MKTIVLLAILLIQSVIGGTPSEALGAFKKAAKTKNFEDTWKHVAKFDGVPDQVATGQKEDIKRFIELFGSGWDFDILEEKTEGDCAVVVINESKKHGKKSFDIDPAYLIKQNGEWRVLSGISDWNEAKQFAKDKIESYKKLETWFESRSETLKKKND